MINQRVLTMKGNHYQIGEQLGNLYKNWGRKSVLIPLLVDQFYPQQLKIYLRYFPDYITLLEGVAKGLKINKDKVLKSFLTVFLAQAWHRKSSFSNGCTCFAININDEILVGRNYDWRAGVENKSLIMKLHFNDKSSYNLTALSDMAIWQAFAKVNPANFMLFTDDAWNEKGLYISLNGVMNPTLSAGFCTPHVIQMISEKCQTVEEAIDILQTIPIHEAKIFTLADKNNHMAVIEYIPNQKIKVRTAKDYILTTNHFNHPDFILNNLDTLKVIPFHATFTRYYFLDLMLKKDLKNVSLDWINKILLTQPLLQNWRDKFSGDCVTVWSYAINLNTKKSKIILDPLTELPVIYKNI